MQLHTPHFTCTGKPLVLQSNYTRFGTEDQQVPANYLWRIVCPDEDMKIVTILMKLNLSRGDYLQIKRKQLEGCEHMDTFRPFFFNKKSIRVSLFSNSTQRSAFELGYVCVGELEPHTLLQHSVNPELWHVKDAI